MCLFGPINTCYEGAKFKCLLRFSTDYPHTPPSLQFLSRVVHPNVHRDGKLCISTLQIPPPDASREQSQLCWSAALGVHGALQSVVSLFADPNPEDPANASVASLFRTNRKQFDAQAKQCAKDSVKDWPNGIMRPLVISPAAELTLPRHFRHSCEQSNTKHVRRSIDEDDDDDASYEYDSVIEDEEE